jgi:hypothetical protein
MYRSSVGGSAPPAQRHRVHHAQPAEISRGRAARSRGCPSDGPILHREIQHACPQLGHDPERCPGVLDDVGEQFGDHQDPSSMTSAGSLHRTSS